MFAYFRAPVGWPELFRRTALEIRRDRCLGLAAELGFYFFLAVFPATLVVLSILTLLPIDVGLARILEEASGVAPQAVLALVRDQIGRTPGGPPGGLLTFAVLGAMWSSSAAMTAIIDTLNRAYDIEEFRSWWKMRLLAVGLTLALAGFSIAALALVVGGADLAVWITASIGGGELATRVWTWALWPLALLLVVVAIDLIYHFAPNAETEWTWVTPGSLLATALWLLASIGVKAYVAWFGTLGALYGSIGGVMVLLLWFYLAGLAILVGAELNAEIDKSHPARDRGPHRPGRRRRIGAAAESAAGREIAS